MINFQNICEELITKKEKLALVGLGYVGLPIAVEFAKYVQVIGFDIDQKRVDSYHDGIDVTQELCEELKKTTIEFTTDPSKLKEAKFIIVAVPTPVKENNEPDLTLLEDASKIIGENLSIGTIVVFESTVYPGVTETICMPIIEQTSHLKCGIDWKIGYSPERINPGDRIHTFSSICKIVSGMDIESATEIQKIYNIAVKAGTFLASSIKTAEAIKLIENSQRDVNIAFMNEIAKICNQLNVDTSEIVEGMNTKWNALGFQPGMVGGHCIGVDSYYLLKLAKNLKCDSSILLQSRQMNESMATYIADIAFRKLLKIKKDVKKITVLIWGITFKENCSDIRNSKVIDLINRLKTYHIEPVITDACANSKDVQEAYGIKLVPFDDLPLADCIIIAVAHSAYKSITMEKLLKMFKDELPNNEKVLIDVKSLYNKDELCTSGICFWRL